MVGFFLIKDSTGGPLEKSVGVLLLFLTAFAAGYFIVLLRRTKCPKCSWTLLRNPKTMGPSDFIVSSDCQSGTLRLFGVPFLPTYQINPWAFQLLRAKKEDRFRCLRCGEDYDLR
jgi:DNA-directed RNA polymerase subunit RPC12/RpoP